MKLWDLAGFSWGALSSHPLRTTLMLLAMAIGVASVILLTALGEGSRRYVSEEFVSLGTHLLIVLPGRAETTGGPPPLLGETPRDLTLEDALAVGRSRAVHRVAPVVVGAAPISHAGRVREVTVLGTTASMMEIRRLAVQQGRFLPAGDPRRGSGVCVLGYEVKAELFGRMAALGEWIRIADRRFRVIGVLTPKGESLGMDMGDVVIIPVASAQALFDTAGLFRIVVQAEGREAIPQAEAAIKDIIGQRHEGEDDITVVTEGAVLETFDKIVTALTVTVGGIAAISLAVAGILIMNVMLIAVSQRTAEIGLLKAIGSPASQIQIIFLMESAMLSLMGAVMGLGFAGGGAVLLGRLYPAVPLYFPGWVMATALVMAIGVGLVFGVLPARRAAAMDPVRALTGR